MFGLSRVSGPCVPCDALLTPLWPAVTQHLRALLAARDDDVADAALRCLTLLTMPPLLHRHQQVLHFIKKKVIFMVMDTMVVES